MNAVKPTKLLIAFVGPAYEHWAPRFDSAFSGNVDRIAVPTINEDQVVAGLPATEDGKVILVNARVAAALSASWRKRLVSECGNHVSAAATKRDDIYCLPQGAPQDGTPVGLDFLVKVE